MWNRVVYRLAGTGCHPKISVWLQTLFGPLVLFFLWPRTRPVGTGNMNSDFFIYNRISPKIISVKRTLLNSGPGLCDLTKKRKTINTVGWGVTHFFYRKTKWLALVHNKMQHIYVQHLVAICCCCFEWGGCWVFLFLFL